MNYRTICFKLEENIANELKKRAIDRNLTQKELLKEIILEELKKEVD